MMLIHEDFSFERKTVTVEETDDCRKLEVSRAEQPPLSSSALARYDVPAIRFQKLRLVNHKQFKPANPSLLPSTTQLTTNNKPDSQFS